MDKIGITKEIDNLGRLVIPKELRERYGLGKIVELVATEEGVLIKSKTHVLVKITPESPACKAKGN